MTAEVEGVGALVEPEAAALVGAGPTAGRVAVDHHHPGPGAGRRRARCQAGQAGTDHHHVRALRPCRVDAAPPPP